MVNERLIEIPNVKTKKCLKTFEQRIYIDRRKKLVYYFISKLWPYNIAWIKLSKLNCILHDAGNIFFLAHQTRHQLLAMVLPRSLWKRYTSEKGIVSYTYTAVGRCLNPISSAKLSSHTRHTLAYSLSTT